MKNSYKTVAGVVASIGLGLAVAAAYAHPGQSGEAGTHGKGRMQHAQGQHGAGGEHGAQNRHEREGGHRHGARTGGERGHGAMAQLMTPEERTALREKMRNATPEERQQIAAATRAEMQKRAQEKGITLPEGHGPRGRAH